MTDNWKIQVSVKIPHDNDNYRDTLVNLRADTEDELGRLLSFINGKGAELGSAVQALRGAATVGQAFAGPGTQTVQQEQPAPWSQPQQEQAPAFAPQQQAGPQQQGGGFGGPPTKYDLSGPPGPAPQCAHGGMDWRHRTSKAGKEYKGWFCPSKNQQQQCETQWAR